MKAQIVKIEDKNAVVISCQEHRLVPEKRVTLPYVVDCDGFVNFRMTEETLKDLIGMIK
jgi:hypothetical protein